MIYPRVDDLLENVDSRYALVIVSAKRARLIRTSPGVRHRYGAARVP